MNYCINSSSLLRNLPFVPDLYQYSTRSDNITGSIIEPTQIVQDLGVHLSNDCSWTPHIQQTAHGARKIASRVLSVFKDRSPVIMTTLFKTMVRSKLEYCSPVWDPHKVGDIQTLENVQRHFTKRINSCKDLNYWDRLKKLKMLSLQRRRERFKIIHVWKLLNNCAPNDINMQFYLHDRLGTRVQIPKFNAKAQKSCSSQYDNSFGIKAARLWNLLPKHVNQQETLDRFKVALGTFLDQFPDTPPVPGYTTTNSNSLLDWGLVGR